MSPADARTKRLFASGVPVRTRARMKTPTCKALKRDVPERAERARAGRERRARAALVRGGAGRPRTELGVQSLRLWWPVDWCDAVSQ